MRIFMIALFFLPVYVYGATCPNEEIQFVVASPIPSDHPNFQNALDFVKGKAEKAGYNTLQITYSEATPQKYLDLLSCPRLRGFFTISHSNSGALKLWNNEYLSASSIESEIDLNERVVFYTHSCNSFNGQLKNTFTGSSVKAQKFIGCSEPANSEMAVSKCFWKKALQGRDMTESLATCEQDNPGSNFEIAGSGLERIQTPAMKASKNIFLHDEL